MMNIPIYIFLVVAVLIFMIAIELKYRTKGICAIAAGILECLVIVLCFISGVTILEQLFLVVLTAIVIMLLIMAAKNNEVK